MENFICAHGREEARVTKDQTNEPDISREFIPRQSKLTITGESPEYSGPWTKVYTGLTGATVSFRCVDVYLSVCVIANRNLCASQHAAKGRGGRIFWYMR